VGVVVVEVNCFYSICERILDNNSCRWFAHSFKVSMHFFT